MTIQAEFTGQMRRLLGLKFVPADMTTHWEALGELSIGELTEAVSQAQRVCIEFPTPAELQGFVMFARSRAPVPAETDRSAARDGEPFVIRAPKEFGGHVLVTADRIWDYYCDDCSDAGVRSFWCGPASTNVRQSWLLTKPCGRRSCLDDHEWSEPCACAATNHEVQRKIAARSQVQAQGQRRRGQR